MVATLVAVGLATAMAAPAADQIDETEARRVMSRPVDVGDGVVVMPAGDIRAIGAGHLSADYTVRGAPGEFVGTVDVRLTAGGLGVTEPVARGGGFGGGASGAVQSRGGGRWSATGAGPTGTLFLDWTSGGRTSLELRYDFQNDKLYVNGERMLRGNNERCR